MNIVGEKCTECSLGYYGFPSCISNVDEHFLFMNFILHYTFLACGCHSQGSNSTECDSSGKCSCKLNVINDKCTACKSEYFGFPDCTGKLLE